MKKYKLYFFIIILLIFFLFFFAFGSKETMVGCEKGKNFVYQVKYFSKGVISADLINGTSTPFSFKLEGDVAESCSLGTDADHFYIRYDFSGLRNMPDNYSDILNENISTKNYAYVKIAKNGYVSEMIFSNSIEDYLLNIYKEYIENSVVNFSNNKWWKSEWENSYKKLDELFNFKYIKNGNNVVKYFVDTKDDYASKKTEIISDIDNRLTRKYSPSSKINYMLNSYNYPNEVKMIRESQVYVLKKRVLTEDTNFFKKIYKIENLKNSENLAYFFEKENESNFIKTDFLAKDVGEKLDNRVLLENFKYKTFQEILENFDWQNKDKHTEYFHNLKSLFMLKPGSLKEVEDYLSSINYNSDDFLLIHSALLSANTDEAQSVMRNVYTRISNEDAKIISIVNLGFFDFPSIETEQFIKEKMNDSNKNIKHTSILAYGNIGKKLNTIQSNRYDGIYSDLSKLYLNSHDESLKNVSIMALGNLAEDKVYKLIKNSLSSENETIRKSAIFSLRFIDNYTINSELLKFLAEDPSVNVKLTVLETIAFRKQSKELIALQIQLLRNHDSELVRSSVLKNLDRAGLVEELKFAKENDSSKSVRDYAELLLAKYL